MNPLRAIGAVLRSIHAGWLLAREGVFVGLDPTLAPPVARPALALARLVAKRQPGPGALTRAITRLGPSYVKLGQFVATRADIVGPAVMRDLEALQDRMPPFPRAEAAAAIEAAFGKPLDEVFVTFGEPVAAASIAQVHRARVREPDGTERDVAVKVLRPGIMRRFRRDFADMYARAQLAERFLPEARRLKPVEVVDTLARSVKIETDFRLEAAAASEFADNVRHDPDFRVPHVDWDRTAQQVLTTDWIDAVALTDDAAIDKAGIDRKALARTVIQSFLRHALRDGFFHADMHQGNLFVDAEGRLVAVDFGIMGRLDPAQRRFLAEILYGFITRDYRRVAIAHFEAGYVPRHHAVEDFAQAIRAIGEPIHARTADQISMAKLLTLLFEITALFDMKTRTELVMLQKTMVVVEGVARRLDPRLDMWSTAEPVVRGWIEDRLGPRGKIEEVGRGLAALGRALADGPQLLERIERLAERAEAEPAPAPEREGGARWRTLALWVIALSLAWMALS